MAWSLPHKALGGCAQCESLILLRLLSPRACSPAPHPRLWLSRPAPGKAEDKAKAQTVSGELMKVDSEKKTIAVKLADGAEWTFDYTATTEISGDKKGEQGLATSEGSKVVVHFTSADGKKTATKVEIQPAAK